KKETLEMQMLEDSLEENKKRLEDSKKAYELETEYWNQSVIMQIQEKEVHTMVTQFYVEASEENLTNAVNAYLNFIKNGALFAEIYDRDNTIGTKYLQEIISVSYATTTVSKDSAIFDIKIVYANKEDCIKYATYIKEIVLNYRDSLENVGVASELKIVDESYYVAKNTEYKKLQETELTTIESLRKSIDTLELKVQELEQQFLSPSFSVKYAVLGGVAGVFISVLILLVKYICNVNIKTAEEIGERTEISMLGKALDDEKETQLLISRIRSLFQNSENRDAFIIGIVDETVCKYWENIRLEVKKYDINLEVLGDVVNDSDAINGFEDNVNVVWCVSNKNTSYKYLNMLMDCCRVKKAKILGYAFYFAK
ncbi:MAG: hypothetical protein ACI4TK_15370, partial [Agathobacter sp.]